jgi:dihydrofolate reductase
MTISIIVAASANNAIGKNNQLIWHLPADLKYFKNLTMGHHIIMGRKTFESIGRALPGRTSIVITRNKNYAAQDCIIVSSLKEAIECVKNDTEAFIIGGAEIFNQAFEFADKIYLTRIHEKFEADTFLPDIDPNNWKIIKQEDFTPDEKNKYNYSFIELAKK